LSKKSTACGLCREMCRFNAISADYIVNPIDCEGCGLWVHFCPEKAIDFPENTCGEWFVSDTRLGRVPFNPIFTKAMIQVQTVIEYNGQSTVGQEIKKIWKRLSDNLEL